MFNVGDLVHVTDRASRKEYVGLEGIVTNVNTGGRIGDHTDVRVTIKVTEDRQHILIGAFHTFWQSLYPLELVNRDPPVCEDWS